MPGLENDEEPRVKGTEPQSPTLNQQVHKNNLAELRELESEMLTEGNLKEKQ